MAHTCCARSSTQTVAGKVMLRVDGLQRTYEKRLRSTAMCSPEKGEPSDPSAFLSRLLSASARRWCALPAYSVRST